MSTTKVEYRPLSVDGKPTFAVAVWDRSLPAQPRYAWLVWGPAAWQKEGECGSRSLAWYRAERAVREHTSL